MKPNETLMYQVRQEISSFINRLNETVYKPLCRYIWKTNILEIVCSFGVAYYSQNTMIWDALIII